MSREIGLLSLNHAMASEPASEDPAATLGFAWRRFGLVLLVGIVGAGIGYLHFLRQPGVYETTAKMLIVRERIKLPMGGIGARTLYDSTHESLIRSPRVLKAAAEKLDVNSLPSLKELSLKGIDPVAAISARLHVTRELDENSPYLAAHRAGDIFQLSYKCSNAEDGSQILFAVFEAYKEFIGASSENESNETIKLIEQAKKNLDTDIRAARIDYQKFRMRAPLLLSDENSKSLHESRLSQIEKIRSDADLENRKLRAEIDSLAQSLAAGASRDALVKLIGASTEKASDQSDARESRSPTPEEVLADRLLPLLLEQQPLLDTYGKDHPKVKAIAARIKLTREHVLAELKARANDEKPAPKKVDADPLDVHLAMLKEKIKRNERVIEQMNSRFREEEHSARELTQVQLEEDAIKSAIRGKERLYDAVVGRLEEISLSEENRGSSIELIFPPGNAVQIEPDFHTIMTIASVAGLLGGFALAYMVDAADRRFRNPDEIRAELGLPVVGHIPKLTANKSEKHDGVDQHGAKLSFLLRAYYCPRGGAAEVFRGIRTALFFRFGTRQIVQVTSPNAGDGKSTLSANLAISSAQSGKRVLLVDADFRRPKLHELFGMPNDKGLSSVLTRSTELSEAIQPTPIKNLWLLTSGPSPPNPSELLGSDHFTKLLEILRQKLDFVIVDTPPVLAVTDPLVVCRNVDGVLLVSRLSKSSRRTCRSALQAFEGLGANILGIVVNGSGSQKGYANDPYYSYGYAKNYLDDRYVLVENTQDVTGHIEQNASEHSES